MEAENSAFYDFVVLFLLFFNRETVKGKKQYFDIFYNLKIFVRNIFKQIYRLKGNEKIQKL